MIYPPVFPSDINNRAEEKVYEALSQLPQDDYDIYFQKTFSGVSGKESADYEIDFLIIDKRDDRFNAILVVEVKGGALSYSAKNNAWYQNGRQLSPGPDAQARRNKHNLLQRFRSIIGEVPIGWVVWFPDGISTAGEFTPTNMRSWQVLDYNANQKATTEIENAFSALKIKHAAYPGIEIESYEKRLKTSLLRGLGIVQPLNILLQQYDEKFLQLENEQRAFFQILYQFDRLAVSGGAGTGKTMLAVGAASDLANEGKKVLFLCFNKMLSLALKEIVSGEGITVSTFHSFAYEYIYEIEPKWYENQKAKDASFYEILFPSKLMETIEAYPPKEKFDVLLIDEAQDFNRSWLALAFKLISQEGKIILFYDENQNIFDRKFEIPTEESFQSFKLEHNYRNTQKICSYVQDETGFQITPMNTPEGVDVKVSEYVGLDDLENKLNQALLKLLMVENLSYNDIVIIVDGRVSKHLLSTLTKIGNFPIRPWDVNSQREEGVVYYTSITRFKGLESNVLLLIKDEKTDHVESKRFYAQCTRAKSLLWIFEKGNVDD